MVYFLPFLVAALSPSSARIPARKAASRRCKAERFRPDRLERSTASSQALPCQQLTQGMATQAKLRAAIEHHVIFIRLAYLQ